MTIGNYTINYNEDGKFESVAKVNGTIYRWGRETVGTGDNIDSFEYVEDSSKLEHNYYLKHIAEDDIVIETYACVRYNNTKEACFKGGLTEDEKPFDDQINSVVTELGKAGIGCNGKICDIGGLTLKADTSAVQFSDGTGYCNVYNECSIDDETWCALSSCSDSWD